MQTLQTSLLGLFILCCVQFLPAQIALTGTVQDSLSGEAMPFVNIAALGAQKGIISDLEGKFKLEISQADTLRFSFLGYRPIKVSVSQSQNINVQLAQQDVKLEDVVILPTENPALRVVRNAISERKNNDIEKFPEFSYDSYNKLSIGMQYGEAVPDSARMDMHLFLMETVTHRDFRAPNRSHETVISSKISGYPGKAIPLTARDIQDLSFYKNYVAVLGEAFLSPVSSPGLNQYNYHLRDTLLDGQDSIFTIHFFPANERFNGFRGNVKIESGKWALVSVQAELVIGEGSLLISSGEIEQVYTRELTGSWVPDQLHTELLSKPFSGSDTTQFRISGLSVLSKQERKSYRKKGKFGTTELELVADAGKMEDVLLEGRKVELNPKDARTYHKLDSLGRKLKLGRLFDQFYKVAEDRVGIGPVDLRLGRLLGYNQVEKLRLGLGVSTNERISRHVGLGGFFGYGFGDKAWKYGGDAWIRPFGNPRLYLGARYANDLVESGFRRLSTRPRRDLHRNVYQESGVRAWYLQGMEYVQTQEAFVGFSLPGNVSMRGTYRLETVDPAYAYRFISEEEFSFTEAEGLLRWAPGEVYSLQEGQRLTLRNNASIFHVRYQRGTYNRTISPWNYDILAISVDHSFTALRKSRFFYHVGIGGNQGEVPRSRMYVFRSNFAPRNYTEVSRTFNTMRMDEFAANTYAEAFVAIQPRLRWMRIGNWAPRLTLSGAAAWGTLSSTPTVHADFPVEAPDQGFFEAGLTLSNLLPIEEKDNILNSYFQALGLGVHYRLGAYAFPDWKDNISVRLTLRIF